jgi:NTE family protein
LVLGAGGSTGEAYHLGVLTALAAATGWDPRTAEVILGTSAGALMAALVRGGIHPDDLAEDVLGQPTSPDSRELLTRAGPRGKLEPRDRQPGRRPWSDPVRSRLLLTAARRPWPPRPGLLAAATRPLGTVDPSPVADRIRRLHADGWPAEQLQIVAVRLADGTRAAFGSATSPPVDVATAAAASCAIPGYLRPVEINGEAYIDGGVHSPTNADLLAGRGLDLVIVSAPMGIGGGALRQPDARRLADLALRSMWRWAVQDEARALRRAGTEVIVAQPGHAELLAMGEDALDRRNMASIIAVAREATLARLRAGGTASLAARLLAPTEVSRADEE